jgi:hypothetical protein
VSDAALANARAFLAKWTAEHPEWTADALLRESSDSIRVTLSREARKAWSGGPERLYFVEDWSPNILAYDGLAERAMPTSLDRATHDALRVETVYVRCPECLNESGKRSWVEVTSDDVWTLRLCQRCHGLGGIDPEADDGS